MPTLDTEQAQLARPKLTLIRGGDQPLGKPGPPWVVSWSELDALRQCMFKHWLAYRDLWTGGEGEALIRGKLWHQVMELHYRAIQQVQGSSRPKDRLTSTVYIEQAFDPIRVLLDQHPRVEPPKRTALEVERHELVWWMYEGYLDEYGPDPEWEIVAVEVPFTTDLASDGTFRFRGRFDLLIKWKRHLWLVDHKTGKRKPHDKDFDLDDQFGLYTWLARQVGHDVWGTLHSWNRTEQLKREMTSEDRFKRTPTRRTEIELDTIAREALLHFEMAYAIDTIDDAPRTTDPERCGWKCGFTDACLQGRKGHQRTMVQLLRSHGHEQWTQTQVDEERGYR